METLQLDSYQFVPYLDRQIIAARIHELSLQLEEKESNQKPIFLVIMTGAFIFAADLLRLIHFDCEVRFVRIKSYSGTQSTGTFRIENDYLENLTNRNVIILEDIVDTGHTIEKISKIIHEQNPSSLKICTLLSKPSAHQVSVFIDYLGFEIPDEFVIGYGLDYNDKGRNLADIWKVK